MGEQSATHYFPQPSRYPIRTKNIAVHPLRNHAPRLISCAHPTGNVTNMLKKQLALAVALMLFAGSAARAADTPGPLRAGAAKVDITPTNLQDFYTVWATRYEGVHDHIYARALVLDNGQTSAAVVTTDLVEFGDTLALRQRIQKLLGIPVDHIMISATHDHSAPRGGPLTPGTSNAEGRPYSPPDYIKFVDDQVVQTVRQAQAALQPARVGIGRGRADINVYRYGYDGKGFNGMDLNGPSDKTVWAVKFEPANGAGQPIALLINYAVHSVVAGPGSHLISGDLAGAIERTVEQHYGGNTVALWTMGPAGDQDPRYMSDNSNFGDGKFAFQAMDAQGLVVGVEAFEAAERITHTDSMVTLSGKESVFSCATIPEKPPTPGAPTMFPPNPDFKQTIPQPSTMELHLNTIRINDIVLAGVSAEVFTKIYWHLLKESPLSNVILDTMSNGRIGYVADDAEYYGPYAHPSVVKGCAEPGIVNGLLDQIGNQ